MFLSLEGGRGGTPFFILVVKKEYIEKEKLIKISENIMEKGVSQPSGKHVIVHVSSKSVKSLRIDGQTRDRQTDRHTNKQLSFYI